MARNIIVDYFAYRQIEFPATIIIGTIGKNESPNAMFHTFSKISFVAIFLLFVFSDFIGLMLIAFQQNLSDFVQNLIRLIVQFGEVETFDFFLLKGDEDAKTVRFSVLKLPFHVGTIFELKSAFPLPFVAVELSLVKVSGFIKLSTLSLSLALVEVAYG